MILTANGNPGSSTLTLRGPTSADADFTIAQTPVDKVISGSSTGTLDVDDVRFDTYNPSTVDHEAQITLGELVQGTLDDYTLESSDESIATVDQTGRVTRVADGTVTILCRTKWLTRGVQVTVSRESGASVQTFKEFVPGSLARHCADAIDTRAAGVTPSTAKPIYTTKDFDSDTFVRNTSCWVADVDLTAISPDNSQLDYKLAGTLISPCHVLFANHYHPSAGTTIYFVDGNNNVVSRTISAISGVSGAGYSKDIAIAKLDSDVPNGISFAQILPSNYKSYLRGIQYGVPGIGLDQEEKALCVEFKSYSGSAISCGAPSTVDRLALNEKLVLYDSSNPAGLVINGGFVLLTAWTYGDYGQGTDLSQFIADINALMASQGGGYSVTTADLSTFPTY